MHRILYTILSVCCLANAWAGETGAAADATAHADAQETAEKSGLTRTGIDLLNPASPLISVANELRYKPYSGELNGATDQSNWSWVVTPSFPFLLDSGKTLLLRAEFPISLGESTYLTGRPDDREYAEWLIRQEADSLPLDGNFFSGHSFLGDIAWDLAWGGQRDNGLIVFYGVAGAIPFSQDGSIERDQWLLGPEVFLGRETDWGIWGIWANHLFDVATIPGKEPREYDTSMTTLEPYIAWQMGGGWELISSPVIEFDWEGAGDNQLYLPLGGGVARMFAIGRVPIRLELELYNYIESPEVFGPDWLMSFNITPVLGKRSRH